MGRPLNAAAEAIPSGLLDELKKQLEKRKENSANPHEIILAIKRPKERTALEIALDNVKRANESDTDSEADEAEWELSPI